MSENNTRLEQLKGRMKRCKCKFCGSDLEIRKIIFSEMGEGRIEIFCTNCDRIEYGVEPETYLCAKYFVEELKFNCYSELPDNEQTQQMSIAKVCEIISWADKQRGFLDPDGFKIPLEMNKDLTGECLIIDDKALDTIEEKIL